MRPAVYCASAIASARTFWWLLLMSVLFGSVCAREETARSVDDEVTLARRDLAQFSLSDVLLLSTLDGSLQARNRDTGAILWTLKSSQLVEIKETGVRQTRQRSANGRDFPNSKQDSYIHTEDSFERLDRPETPDPADNDRADQGDTGTSDAEQRIMWLAEPSADGGLYFFTPESGIERIPASVHDLVQKAPFGMVGNIVYTGSRQTTLYALDVQTGEILQAFGSYLDYANPSAVAAALADPLRVIMIGRTEYTLDMHEQLGAPGWRVRIGVWTPNSRDQDLAGQYTGPLDSVYVTPLSNSTVMALAENDMRPQRWVSEVPALLVDVFDILQSPSDHSLALVRQPPLKLSGPSDKQGHTWDLYVSEAPDGSAVVVRGLRYSALLGSVARAPYCDYDQFQNQFQGQDFMRDPSEILGVHPAWCQEKRRNPSRAPPAMSLLPASSEGNTGFPLIDPPDPVSQIDGTVGGAGKWQSGSIITALVAGAFILAVLFWFRNPQRALRSRSSGPRAGDETSLGEDSEPKRRKRGTRGGKNRKQNASPGLAEGSEGMPVAAGDSLTTSAGHVAPAPPITVSDVVLGYGSHGTTVFKGRFENRDVAVKRMLLEFYDVASQEVDILRESDDHPNVVRYFYKYQTDQFLYIALELCPGTLEELVRGTHQFSILFDPLEALRQIAQGLQHLHNLQIVHRDIKPQNILVALPNSRAKGAAKGGRKRVVASMGVRYLISDFGLCRKLEGEQSSFLPTAADSVAGTAGWAAPEISSITNQVKNQNENTKFTKQLGSKTKKASEENTAKSSQNGTSTKQAATEGDKSSEKSSEKSTDGDKAEADNAEAEQQADETAVDSARGWMPSSRLTRAVDIFSIGCLFYYVLTGGKHPFGDAHMRQVNIQQGRSPVLEAGGLMSAEAMDLIPSMLQFDPGLRPTINDILKHPLFWTEQRKLDFLVRVSDRLEHESREDYSELIDRLEVHAPEVVGKDWHQKFPQLFVDNLGKYRRYHGDRILDLLRALRNKLHHYNDFSDELKACVGPVPQGYLAFFTDRFPLLVVTAYYYAKAEFYEEDAFKDYF